ncbi:hypothetical protein DFJ58DRAFT_909804 [Suillus subalutaceus]|uniref:uncharacterized protein n=1 Tax=Suillus subalutaceus TaxID=48586 RepID=UPI001B86E251|nr:uncharacterized protein DFJ58DRAFT_909804 [Suillus subalutaceus]KAG1876553.1 hypothetical protein DFJ58DRAFT_909804 [Suillus subalutaceus]
MTYNNANTFSSDKVATPEVPGLLNGGTFLVASPGDRTLPDNVSCLFFLKSSNYSSSKSSCSAGFLGLPQWPTSELDSDAFGTTDGVYEDSGSDLNEISQSPLVLESRDTGDLQLAIIQAETVPQKLYQPRGKTELEKYVHTANLSSPILFYAEKPSELGIALEEILKSNSRCLGDRDDLVFEGGGRTISVRIEWPGYRRWNCQLPTKDYRKTPGPITKAKLAKNLATCIRRFIQKMANQPMEADSDPMWMISPHHIKFEDLVLVSLDHVSQGSWQPQLRLRQQD